MSELFEKFFDLKNRLRGRVVAGDNPVTIDAIAADPDAIGNRPKPEPTPKEWD